MVFSAVILDGISQDAERARCGLEEKMAVLERAIELCRFFGTELVRGFAFWKQGELTEAVWRDIKAAFRTPVALAEREGIILGLENEHACMLGTGRRPGG